MKKIVLAVMMICFFFVGGALAGYPRAVQISEPIPGQSYFDQRFDALERSTAEIKGDTSQIVSILGNVFEGTVPSGGTLTSLCNKMGWNLVVLMGHNGISDPNVVAAGQKFTYPQTHEEFQSALAKGKPLYDNWLKNQSTTFRVNRIKADTVDIDELNVRVATFKEKLAIKDMEIDKLRIRLAEITEKLSVKEAEIETLRVKNAEIENLRIKNANLENVYIDKLRIRQLEIDNLRELLTLAENRCRELEARPPKIVERAVPVTPGSIQFRQDSGCGEPYSPKSWEWQFIYAAQDEGVLPVFWHVYHILSDGSLKVKIDYYDTDTKKCYSIWCQYDLPYPEIAIRAIREAGFIADDGVRVKDGGKYNTQLAGRVTSWPGEICLK